MRTLLRYILFLVALLAWFRASAHFIPNGTDFVQDYCAARLTSTGEPIFGPAFEPRCLELTGVSGINNFHPPPYTTLVRPLAGFDYRTASWIWSTILLLSFWFITRICISLVGDEKRDRLLYFSALMLWAPAIECIGLLAISPILALGTSILIAFRAGKFRENDLLEGVVLGLLASVKLFPGLLFMPYLIAGRFRTCLAAILSVLVFFAITANQFGISQIAFYFSQIVNKNVNEFAGFVTNDSINGVLISYFLDTPWSTAPFQSAAAKISLQIALSIATLISAWIISRKAQACKRPDLSLAIWVPSMILLSPISWTHSLVMLLAPLSLLLKDPRYHLYVLIILIFGAVPTYVSLGSMQLYFHLSKLSPALLPFAKFGFYALILTFVGLAIAVRDSGKALSPK